MGGLDIDIIRDVLKTFPGVEHRIEYVDTIDGVKFYNDSKGTNSDASIKAIEAVSSPIILIAGGVWIREQNLMILYYLLMARLRLWYF